MPMHIENLLKVLAHTPCNSKQGKSCATCRKLTDLEIEFRRLQSQLLDIQEQHERLLVEGNEAHDRFARLPIELNWKILEDCCEPFQPHPDPPSFTPDYDSIACTIASVCKAWKEIALQSPVLWQSLLIDVSHLPSKSKIHHLQRRFDRAGQLPLSIYLYLSGMYPRPDTAFDQNPIVVKGPRLEALTNFICSNLAAIGVLSINLPYSLLKWFNRAKIPEAYTLDELHIYASDSRPFGQLPPPIAFGASVTARKVYIEQFPPSQLHIEWEKVEGFTLREEMVDSTMHVLAKASRVTLLDLDFRGSEGLVDYPPPPFVVPAVEVLHTSEVMTMDMTLSTTIMPLLTTLEMGHLTCSDLSAFQPQILSFVNHCASNLTSLSMHIFVDSDFSNLIPIIEATPEVSSLTLGHDFQTDQKPSIDQFYKRLTIPSDHSDTTSLAPPILPKLQTLALVTDFPLNWVNLLQFACSRVPDSKHKATHRRSSVGTLRSIQVEVENPELVMLELEVIEKIDGLRQAGCHFLLFKNSTDFSSTDIVEESRKHLGLV